MTTLRQSLMWIIACCTVGMMFARLPHLVARQDSVVRLYSPLIEVDAHIRKEFVEFVDPPQADKLVEGAIAGMMRRLDPYSRYLGSAALEALMQRQRGHYTGIGVELGVRNDRLTVIAPIESGPADRAGIRAGDVVLAIDGQKMENTSVAAAHDLLVGAPGQPVTLTLLRYHDTERRATGEVTITVERGDVSFSSVRGRIMPDDTWDYMLAPREAGIGYVRIVQFNSTTVRELETALLELERLGARGLIMDLRGNPGGQVEQAVAVVDRFVEAGTILSTVTRRNAVREYRARAGRTDNELPLVVLIDGGSASASEIVAGSLQDHDRATIIGSRSFGKGSVQTLIPLTGHDAAIKLTTSYYRLPGGRIIHRTAENEHTDKWGVIPDVEVAGTVAGDLNDDPQIRAALSVLSGRGM